MVFALRMYIMPLLLAVAIHALAALALMRGFNPETLTTKVIKPQIVQSKLIVLEPKRSKTKPKPVPKPMLTPAPVVQPKPEAKPTPAPKPKKVEPAKPKVDKAAQRKAEQDKQRQQEQQAKAERLQALADQSFLDALDDEQAMLDEVADASDAAVDAAAAQSFRMGIYQAVVGNWSRPPSARQGMQVTLLVELVPTGDVVSVSILDSSGNGAFDRSAQSAVNKVGQFVVPKESELFERHFRKFTLLFKPEDLLR